MTTKSEYFEVDPQRIDGKIWYEAVAECDCGRLPEVWRTYSEVQGSKRYAVRCHRCNHEIVDSSRRRAIRRWNEAKLD